MLVALNGTDERVMACDVTKDGSPYLCPVCRGLLILHKGRIKVHHFAHKPPVECTYGAGESEEHHRIKTELYNALRVRSDVARVEVEFPLNDKQRPDIIFKTRSGQVVAVELQRSSITIPELERRTKAYALKGISVLWVAVGLPEPDGKEVRTSDWQFRMHGLHSVSDGKEVRISDWQFWVHGLYFGKLYVHRHGAQFTAIALGNVTRFSDGGHDREGNEFPATARVLKTTKTLIDIGSFDVVTGFAAKPRKEWRQYPSANLWVPAP